MTDPDVLEMPEVTVELDEETIARLDDLAFEDHRDNRAAAIRELLDAWLKHRE